MALLVLAAVVGGLWKWHSDRPPEELMQESFRLSQRRDFKGAAALLDKLLNSHPGHLEGLLARAQVARDLGQPEDAVAYLSRINSGAESLQGQARFLEANVQLETHHARLAESLFLQAMELSPKLEVQCRERLIPLYVLQNRPDAIRQQLTGLRSTRGLTLAEMSLWITADGRIMEASTAIPMLEEFVQSDSTDEASLCGLIAFESLTRHDDYLAERLSADIRTNPDHEVAIGQLYFILKGQKQTHRLSSAMKPLRLCSSTPLDVWLAFAELSQTSEDWERAEVTLRYLAQAYPFRRDIRYQFGQLLQREGKSEEAELAFRQSEQLNLLHSSVETIGVLLNRNALGPGQVADVSRILLELNLFLEAEEWARMALAAAGPQGTEYAELASLCRERRLDSQSAAVEPPWERWSEFGPILSSLDNPSAPSSQQGSTFVLADEAKSLGLDFHYENGHTGRKYLVEAMGGSVAAIDFDRDGWVDLYCPQGGTLGDGPNCGELTDRLFRNLHGSFRDVTNATHVRELNYSQGCGAGDLDNDGFEDLVIANAGPNTLYINNGDGTLDDASLEWGLTDDQSLSSSVALADLDSDGDLDLYVVNYVDSLKICRDDKGQFATCNPNSHTAAADQLYENDGRGGFRNVTEQAQVTAHNGKGLGIVVAHLDEDAKPDIFITNDTTPNFLYRNAGEPGKLEFSECGVRSGVAVNSAGVAEAGMGIAHGDVNHDAKLDLYVTNFLRESNTLLLQTESGVFEDVTSQAQLQEPTLPFLGFGTQAVDLDLDGWSELFVANGHIDDLLEKGDPWKMRPQLFTTVDGKQWQEADATTSTYMQGEYLGRAVIVWDPDRNGVPDLAVAHQDCPVACLVNRTLTPHHWITVSVIGTRSNRSGVNTQFRWIMGGQKQIAELAGGDGYYCSNERQLFIGLGSHESLESLEIVWPNGVSQEFRDLQGNRQYVVVEGQVLRPRN